MKLITTLTLLFIGLCSFAQNVSLTIFNNGGQQFFVIMNGIRQNSLPKTNVKIGGMTTGSYEIKLIFADGKTGDINKKIFVDMSGDYLARVVMKGKKNKLQYFGMSDGSQPMPAGGTDIQYRPNDQSVYSDQNTIVDGSPFGGTNNGQSNGAYQQNTNMGGNQGTSQQSTTVSGQDNGTMQTTTSGTQQSGTMTTTTTVNGSQNGTMNTGTTVTDPNLSTGQAGMNININVQDPTTNGGTGGVNVNMSGTGMGNESETFGTSTTITDPTTNGGNGGVNVNMSGTGMGQGTTTSSSTVTTSSSSTTTQNGQVVSDTYQQTTSVTQNGQTNTTTQSSQYGNPVQETVNTNGYYNCTSVLTDIDAFVEAMNNESFDPDKREMVEKDLKSKCVSADQAYRIVNALTFDADRIDISKYLYDRMTDKANGKRLLELLTFDDDKEEFKQYMKTH